ncbi:FMN-binding glutamate synthase family protein [Oceanobacillus sojae]|uniref:FMN-binding glutamate synthase family protein n=1 Tax=Oceanobacillus sojae TaxID=582851 RepID=UPI0021A785A4|nr:FMN-binding glutamate synthase family protein [Oceanobacillus sojae]MCT1904315.1 FMN-binding glutamate synthase family protein [Oceanobacillus sojae]
MLDIFILILLILFIVGWLMMFLMRKHLIKRMVYKFGKILMEDRYQENIFEMVTGFKHMGFQRTFENNLRAESGDVLHRPLGSAKTWPDFEKLTFIPAQAAKFPTEYTEKINMKVTIGPKAKKPMQLDIPLMISGMAYGIALSKEVRLALVDAVNQLGTALNSGEGGVMEEEIDGTDNYILQFSKTSWSKEKELIKRASMIEIKFGQGALMSSGVVIPAEDLQGDIRKVLNLGDGEEAIIHNHFFENQTLEDFKNLVQELREMTDGVPIGAKIGAGGKIEEDIDALLEIGVDYIAVDGAQAATHGAPPILSEDFGIPTIHGLQRAHQHLKKRNAREDVSLVISGGMFNAGQFLKAIALGADAVYLGSVILFTLSHKQVLKAVPFEPPTQVVWYDGKYKDDFNRQEGTKALVNFINASTKEMEEGIRIMGKTALSEVKKDDLVSYDEAVARDIGVPFSAHSYEEEAAKQNKQEPMIEL